MAEKSPEDTQLNAANYHIINKPRTYIHPQTRRGSGGLLLFVQKRIWENVQILENTDMEDRIRVKFVCEQNEAPKKIYIYLFLL